MDRGPVYTTTDGHALCARSGEVFSFRIRGDRARFVEGAEFDVNAGWAPLYQKMRGLVFGGPSEVVRLSVPSDCTRHFESDTPVKQRMLKAVVTTVAEGIGRLSRYPNPLKMTVANFNSTDPGTFVLVSSTNDVFSVQFASESDPWGDDYLRREEYPIEPVNNRADPDAMDQLRTKIRMYGLAQTITIPGRVSCSA